jgi:hypothetical protein
MEIMAIKAKSLFIDDQQGQIITTVVIEGAVPIHFLQSASRIPLFFTDYNVFDCHKDVAIL